MAFVDETTESSANIGATVDLATPALTAAGDLLIAMVHANASGTITPPAGWDTQHSPGGSHLAHVFSRICQAGDLGGSFTFTQPGSSNRGGFILAYRGESIVDVVSGAADANGATGGMEIPTVTPSRAGYLIGIWTTSTANVWTVGSVSGGMTTRADTGHSEAAADLAVSANTATGVQTVTPSGSLPTPSYGVALVVVSDTTGPRMVV